jgi:putative transposase
MARQRRIFIPDLSLHVIQRGNNRIDVFKTAADYEWFLALVRSAAIDCHVDIHGYVLMTTHYHLIATPGYERALSLMMKEVDGLYARYFNRQHGRMGTLWNGRYRGLAIRDERYWLTCLRYIEQNPVRAHMVANPEAYRWSSYHIHALGAPSDWLTPHPLYLSLGTTPEDRQAAYKAVCTTDLIAEELALVRQQRPSRAGEVTDVGVCHV